MSIEIPVQMGEESCLPVYATDGAAGADLYAAEDAVLLAGESALISTNLRMAIPAGFELQIRPRSGLALKHQITVLNSPGTIDSDYRGVIGVILINHGTAPFTVHTGDRIAQCVLATVHRMVFSVQRNLSESERGSGGFGSTGQQ